MPASAEDAINLEPTAKRKRTERPVADTIDLDDSEAEEVGDEVAFLPPVPFPALVPGQAAWWPLVKTAAEIGGAKELAAG